MEVKRIYINVDELNANVGQIDGLPANPRVIKKHRFDKTLKSINDDPEMLELREIIAYPHETGLVIICGNMRYEALKYKNVKETPVKILPKETPVRKLRAYAIKDNVSYGENNWEEIANNWDINEVKEWGVEGFPFDGIDEDGDMNMPTGWMLTVKSDDVKQLEAIEKDLISKGLDVKLKEK